MLFYKIFLITTATLPLLATTMYSLEDNPAQAMGNKVVIPSLLHICMQTYAREAKKATNLAGYFEQLRSKDLTEEEFYGLVTAEPGRNTCTLLQYAAKKDLAGTQTLLDIYAEQEKRFNGQREAIGINEKYPSLHDYIELRNKASLTALDLSFMHEQFAIADFLVKSGASYTQKRIIRSVIPHESFLLSPLNHAIVDNNPEWCDYLLSRGVSVQESTTQQIFHIPNKNEAAIESLKRQDWPVIQPEEYGLTAQEETLFLSPNTEDATVTAMTMKIQDFDYDLDRKSEIIWKLIRQTDSTLEQNHLLHQGIHMAIITNTYDSLTALLKKAPENILTRYPDILIRYIKYDPAYSDAVPLLIERGAIVNIADHDGNTPLHLVVLRQNFKTVRRLVKAGAHINAINDRGDTPLNTLRSTQRTPERTQIRRYLIQKGGLGASKLRSQM